MAKKLAFDKVLFVAVVTLVVIGLVMVYSASSGEIAYGGSGLHPFIKQIFAAVVGLGAMVVAMVIDYRQLRRPILLYGLVLAVLMLLIAALLSPALNNTNRWVFFGGFSLQPSELAKLALIVFFAYQLDRKWDRVNQPSVLVPCISLTALWAVLILLQPDMGTAGLIVMIGALMLFLAGLSWRYLLGGVAVLFPAAWFLIFSVPYRRQRIFSFLEPELDPQGSGFQVLQSMIAVGSGGVRGLGLGESVQKLQFLPLAESDFIYSILAEELGLIGAVSVLLLFALVFWRGIRAGQRAPENFGRFLAFGISVMLLGQALVNVSVVLALLPTTGAPLPFISYGGSSMVTTMTACGLLLNVSQHG